MVIFCAASMKTAPPRWTDQSPAEILRQRAFLPVIDRSKRDLECDLTCGGDLIGLGHEGRPRLGELKPDERNVSHAFCLWCAAVGGDCDERIEDLFTGQLRSDSSECA